MVACLTWIIFSNKLWKQNIIQMYQTTQWYVWLGLQSTRQAAVYKLHAERPCSSCQIICIHTERHRGQKYPDMTKIWRTQKVERAFLIFNYQTQGSQVMLATIKHTLLRSASSNTRPVKLFKNKKFKKSMKKKKKLEKSPRNLA
jgi:hypothetical protein